MSEIDFYGDEEGFDTPAHENFVIDTLEKAEWALRKKGTAQGEIERMETYAVYLTNRIMQRLEQITKVHRDTVDTMDALLRPWANVEIAKASGRKSVKLLAGTLGFRSSVPSLLVTDEVAAVKWLKKHKLKAMVRVKEEVKKAEVKKLIEEKGEIPDGVELKPGETRFYAEPLGSKEIEGGTK